MRARLMAPRSRPSRLVVAWLASLAAVCLCGATGTAWGGEMYSYTDDSGTVVMTNKLDTVPEKYRSRVKVTHTPGDSDGLQGTAGAVTSAVQSAGQLAAEEYKKLTNPSELERSKSIFERPEVFFSLAGVLGVLMLATMKFTSSASTKMLMKWLLVLLIFGSTVKGYFDLSAAGSPSDLMKKATGAGTKLRSTQQDKQKQIDRLEAGAKSPP